MAAASQSRVRSWIVCSPSSSVTQVRDARIRQNVQDRFGHAVGPGADGHSHNVRMGCRLLEQAAQAVQGTVGVRGGLEIGDEVIDVVSGADAADALVELGGNRIEPQSPAGAEAFRVAKNAPLDAQRPVAVGAGAARVEAHFPDGVAKLFAVKEIPAKVTESGGPPAGRFWRWRGEKVV